MNPVVSSQIEELKRRFSDTEAVSLRDGSFLVSLAIDNLPPQWNKSRTKVWVVVPVGYPVAKPDCFWAEEDLRLANNTTPQNTAFNPIPNFGGRHLWFSWHAKLWNPNRDSLLTYIKLVETRLRDPK